MHTWIAGLVALLLSTPLGAAVVTTAQSGISQVDIDSVAVLQEGDTASNGVVSVAALHGGPPPDAQARTAARSSSSDIAANSLITDRTFDGTNYTLVLSQANYTISVVPDNVFVRQAAFDFFLPPSYLEITSNAELQQDEMEAVLMADIRACVASICTSSDSVFHLQANLTASYDAFNHGISAIGDPQLDLSAFTGSTPTVTDDGFLRTVNLSFDGYTGHLDLGSIPAGSAFNVEYVLQTRVSGRALYSTAIAAINDPFLLSTDPVVPGAGIVFTGDPTTVPLPASAWLFLGAAGLLAGLQRRSEGRGVSASR